jgi:hypothetical protein
MALIINIKTKKEEKIVKDFLTQLDIDFQTIAEEGTVEYTTLSKKALSHKEKKILNDLEQSVDFVNKYKRGKIKARSINQLLNEL